MPSIFERPPHACIQSEISAALAQLPEALRSERRGWGWNSLTRHHFAHVVQRRDSALKTRTVPVQIRPWAPTACSPISRGVPLKTGRLQVRVLPRGPIWNVNRTSEPGLFAKQCAPGNESVAQIHGIPPCARSSKRAVRLISGVALDECRVPERYRTRVPI